MPPRPADVRSAARALSALIVAADAYRVAAAARDELELIERHAIGHLERHGPLPQSRLAQLLGITPGAVTGLVDRLERDGMARRDPDPQDRRRNRVRLTPHAERILAESEDRLAGALADLPSDVLPVLAAALPLLATGVERKAQELRG